MSETDTSRTAVYAPFDGQERKFQLRLGEIAELERKCGAGIGEIMVRLAQHRFYAADIFDTIRLGLEGGGTPKADATATVMRLHADPLSDHLQLAADILSGAVAGVKREGKAPTEGERRRPGDLSVFYGAGGALQWTPEQVDRMTWAAFEAALEGYIAAHRGPDEAAPSEDEYLAVLAEEIAAGRA